MGDEDVATPTDPGTPAPTPAEPGAGDTGGGSPDPQLGAGAPPPASPPGASPGSKAEPRTYLDADVQRIVRDRLADEQKKYAPYKELGDPEKIRERLARADKLEAAFKGETPQEPSQEERELRNLLTTQFPGIDKVQGVEKRLAAIESRTNMDRTNTGRDLITRLAGEKLGVKDTKAIAMIEGAVASSIAADKESLEAWNAGDVSVVDKHFESVFTGSLEPLLKSASARYASGKAKDVAELPPTVSKGGVPAPVSEERKLSGEERRDAAWKRFQELEGRG
jgi:hypothetical protein